MQATESVPAAHQSTKRFEEDVLVKIQLAAFHQLGICGKDLVRLGPFQLILRRYLETSTFSTYLVINGHFHHLEPTCKMLRIDYQESISYVIESSTESNFMHCLTFPADANTGDVSNFEAYARMQVASFLTSEDPTELHGRLQVLVPKVDTEPIYVFGGMERTVNKGAIIANKQIARLSAYIKEKIGKGAEESGVGNIPNQPIATEPSWFDRLTSKTVKVYNATSKAFSKVADPLIQGGKKLNDKLCEKIDRSDHKILHKIKNFAARSNNSIKSAFYTLKTQKAENLEHKKPSVTDTTSEPINMMIEQTSPLNEIPGRDDKPATTDPVYNYHTFDNETTNK